MKLRDEISEKKFFNFLLSKLHNNKNLTLIFWVEKNIRTLLALQLLFLKDCTKTSS